MGSLIDTIGAVIIGGILLLTMINALFHIHAQGINIEQHTILTEVSERIATIMGDYLTRVGAGITPGSAILDSTTVNSFRFNSRDSTHTSIIRQFYIVQGDSITNKGYPLRVNIDGVTNLGPFWLSDELKFTYYDVYGDSISFVGGLIPAGQLNDIRSLKLKMEFFYDAFAPDSLAGPDRKDPKNQIIIWSFFPNLYL